MGDSRCRDGVTGGDRAGGRGRGGRHRAGALACGRRRAWICAVAGLAGLASPGVERGARAQQPEAPQQATPSTGSDQDLSLRYRFVERYGLTEDLGRPDQLVQYQVGSIETIRREVEQARGAPDRQEFTYRTIYTERPARLGRLGEVTDTVRRYDMFRAGGAAQADPRAAILLKDLTFWYQLRAAGSPELISLTPNRPIRQLEYDTVLTQIFSPRLSAVLPTRPVRVADTWKISRQSARVLIDKVPEAGNFRLDGTLVKVDKAAEGTAMTAIIDLAGELDFQEGDGAVRARLWFLFEPLRGAAAAAPKEASSPSAKGGGPRDADVVEARGYTAKLSMSLRKTLPLDEEGRLQQTQTGEIQLQRRPVPGPAGALAVPDKKPTPDETNSWLLFDDPQGRFHLRHRQDLAVEVNEPDALVLHHASPRGKSDTMIIGDVPRETDPARDRQWTDPQAFVRNIQQNSERRGFEVITGPMGWLPDQDWAPLKRKVYRYEAALKQKDGSRLYLDAYLVLFSRGDHFVIQALTDQDDHVAFRDQAETLIKTLELGPSAPGMGGVAAQQPASTPPADTAPADTAPSPDRPAPPPVPRRDRRP